MSYDGIVGRRVLVGFAVACGACSSTPSGAPDAEAGVDDAVVMDAGDAGDGSQAGFTWAPGNYVMLNNRNAETTERDAVLADAALMTGFVGLQKEYEWSFAEGAQGDYTAGIDATKADLDAVAKANKKLIVFLTYKTFTTGAHAVPAYMLGAGPWCVGSVCGEGAMSNGTTAMIWVTGVQDRLHAWFVALGAAIGAHPALAGLTLPESACGNCSKLPQYIPATYVTSMEGNATSILGAFPTSILFQYINFIDGAGTAQSADLTQFADFALATKRLGLGCPDLGPGLNLPEYPIFENTKYRGRVPLAPSVQSPDFSPPATIGTGAQGVAATYDLGTSTMAAQIITWSDVRSTSAAFTIQDVGTYVAAHPMPNVAAPTW